MMIFAKLFLDLLVQESVTGAPNFGPLAQLVMRLICTEEIRSSSLLGSTEQSEALRSMNHEARIMKHTKLFMVRKSYILIQC